MVDSLGDPYQAAVCDGISSGVRNSGDNLLYFVGGTLPVDPSEAEPRYRVYELAAAQSLSG